MHQATSQSHPETLLTPAEAAQRLHVSPVTIRHWALHGRLPYVTTPGGHRRFRACDIEQLAATGCLPADSQRPLRVLIVEADPQEAERLADMVCTCCTHARPLIVHDGFEAALQLQEQRPDLVLLAMQMPGMDTEAVCRHIRQHAQLRHTRVIGMTGEPSPEGIAGLHAASAEACLVKPLSPDALRAVLQHPRHLHP